MVPEEDLDVPLRCGDATAAAAAAEEKLLVSSLTDKCKIVLFRTFINA